MYSSRYDADLLTSPTRSLHRSPAYLNSSLYTNNADTSSHSSPLRFDSSARSQSSAYAQIDPCRESRYSSYRPPQTLADHIQCNDVEENVIHVNSRPLPRGGVTKSIPFCPTVVEELRVGMRVSVNR